MNMLQTYVHAWRDSADAILALTSDLDESQWSTATDCPGWSVKDVVAHLAHLESDLINAADEQHPTIDAREMPTSHTELGVSERRDHTSAEVLAELATGVAGWARQLDPMPADPQAMAPTSSSGLAWSWDTLLRNRAIDMWVHEQDIRRAIGRPGGLDSTGALVTTTAFSFAMPFILGKRVRPRAGASVRWNVSGEVPVDLTVEIGDDGRAHRVEGQTDPTATLSMSTEGFTVLAAGRRSPESVDVKIRGDEELARATLAAMAITP